jgi:DNA adenine methylase
MRYLGGKSKVGKRIANAILAHTKTRSSYYEPFLGGGESFRHIAPHFEKTFASDIHEDLILMWKEAANGWVPPSIDESTYRTLKDAQTSALRGFAGFGCSFGGKWWGGFARGEDRDYSSESSRNICKIAMLMKTTNLRTCSYADLDPEIGSVVYADPPYANTTGYFRGFDHDAFWMKMREWSERGIEVFVSEYVAPSDWKPIWEGSHRQYVSKRARAETTERLFVRA